MGAGCNDLSFQVLGKSLQTDPKEEVGKEDNDSDKLLSHTVKSETETSVFTTQKTSFMLSITESIST